MAKKAIKVTGLVNEFNGQVVHDKLDFKVDASEILGLVGGSGAGKTLLLRSIIGLHHPSGGCIKVDGKDITKLSKYEMLDMQRLWGVLFQNGALFSSMTVENNIMLPIQEFTDATKEQARSLARMKIELVGLPVSARHKFPNELSGGMVKRAALARALALDPKILFLDEPTAGLDPIAAAGFDNLIRELCDHLRLAVVIITHDLDTIFGICDRVAVLVDKKIKVDSLENLLQDKHPWIQEYFHGVRSRAIECAREA